MYTRLEILIWLGFALAIAFAAVAFMRFARRHFFAAAFFAASVGLALHGLLSRLSLLNWQGAAALASLTLSFACAHFTRKRRRSKILCSSIDELSDAIAEGRLTIDATIRALLRDIRERVEEAAAWLDGDSADPAAAQSALEDLALDIDSALDGGAEGGSR